MINNIYSAAQQYSQGNLSYDNFQKGLAVSTLQQGLQQALQVANEAKLNAAKQGMDAAQMTLLSMMVSQDAINQHIDTIKTTQTIQLFNNQIADRNKQSLLQSATNLQQSLAYNFDIFNKQKNKAVGEVKQAAVQRGVLASEGSSNDMINQTLNEISKDQSLKVKSDLQGVSQAYENALAVEISKSFDNWNTQTQIDLSNKALQHSMAF